MRAVSVTALGLVALLLSACGQTAPENFGSKQDAMASESAASTLGITSPPADLVPESATDASSDSISAKMPVSAPQIAYEYSYGYRLGIGDIGPVQQKHLALCDALGVVRCRIVSLQRESNDGEFVTASLSLQVDSKIARDFGLKLDKAASDAGGDVASRSITAEDLSKDIVDTAARIKAKQALADRLLLLITNRSGKVGELVEAERAFAEAQEELDAARSWMATMQQRVSMSKVEISYASNAPSGNGFWRPVRDSFASAGQTFGNSIGAVVTFVVVVAPWIALLLVFVWLFRKLGWSIRFRWPWRKSTGPASETSD